MIQLLRAQPSPSDSIIDSDSDTTRHKSVESVLLAMTDVDVQSSVNTAITQWNDVTVPQYDGTLEPISTIGAKVLARVTVEQSDVAYTAKDTIVVDMRNTPHTFAQSLAFAPYLYETVAFGRVVLLLWHSDSTKYAVVKLFRRNEKPLHSNLLAPWLTEAADNLTVIVPIENVRCHAHLVHQRSLRVDDTSGTQRRFQFNLVTSLQSYFVNLFVVTGQGKLPDDIVDIFLKDLYAQ